VNLGPASTHNALRLLQTLALVVPVAVGAQVAAAGPAPQSNLPPQALADALALARHAAQALAPPGARVDVVAGQLDSRLQLAPCTQVQAYQSAGMPAWGRTRVGLRCATGPTAWNVFLPVTVQVWARAAVSTAPLPAGTRLTPGALALAEVDWAAASAPPFATPEALAGRVLARPVAAGQPLRQTDVQVRQWFALGDRVRVDARGAGFAISAEGQALTPGMEGQNARVRIDNGRVLTGRPVAERQLEVKL
jgi:flagella basal body P-ring formation protein FlgA